MATVQRITWEHVSPIAHPEHYQGDHPVTPAYAVPDAHWTRVEKTGDVLGQYHGLLRLVASDELIRNVRLFEGESTEPEWTEVAR